MRHVGRSSGRLYETILEVISYDPTTGEAVVMSGWGGSSDWYRNVRVAGRAEVILGRQATIVVVRFLDEQESVATLADYEMRNRLMRPVIRKVLSWLSGIHYDGSDAGRARLARELPLVAFRPIPADADR